MLERIQVKREDDKMGEGMMLGTMGSPAAVTGELSQWERSGSIPEHTTVQQQSTPIPPLWSHNAPLAGFAPQYWGWADWPPLQDFRAAASPRLSELSPRRGGIFWGLFNWTFPGLFSATQELSSQLVLTHPCYDSGYYRLGKVNDCFVEYHWISSEHALRVKRLCLAP